MWWKFFWVVLLVLRSVRVDERGIIRDVNNFFYGSKGRVNVVVNVGLVLSWCGCGDGG